MPLRGVLGSDLVKATATGRLRRTRSRTSKDPILYRRRQSCPTSRLFHARWADEAGNVWVGRRRELATLAHASRNTYVTVEEVRKRRHARGRAARAGRHFARLMYRAWRIAPSGAWPLGIADVYGIDDAHLALYAKAAKTREGFEQLPGRVRLAKKEELLAWRHRPPDRRREACGGRRGVADPRGRRASSQADKPALRVSMLHKRKGNPFTEGSRELFDLAGQGRIDVFFLGGAQIDGEANINLVRADGRRFPGSFGSAFMYSVVPRTILFREEHSRAYAGAEGGVRLGARRPPIPPGAGSPARRFSAGRRTGAASGWRACIRCPATFAAETGFDFDLLLESRSRRPRPRRSSRCCRGTVRSEMRGRLPRFRPARVGIRGRLAP